MAITRPVGANRESARLLRDRHPESADPAGSASRAPVIVLAQDYAGIGTLRTLLEGHQDLACTAGTGVLPLCDQALMAWSNADGRPGRPPSALALAATRNLVTSVITSILAREGKPRWCETAAANPESAEAFLRLYPGTRFLLLYRACPGVIRAVLDASPWGLSEPVFAPFTQSYPASAVAALTAYWVAVVGTMLDFERAHPGDCLRVRYEDLTGDQPAAEERVVSFLGLARSSGRVIPGWLGEYDELSSASANTGPADPPGHLIPPPLLARANELLRQLDYPVMVAS